MQRSEMVGVRTRGAVAILVSLLVAMLFVAAEPAAASHYTNTTELSGTTNAAAAAAWSKVAFTGTATEVLLGRDDVFADSLASGAMQGSRPLLLTNSQTLSGEANAELNRLRPSIVNILGGPSAVSTAVENDLKSKGYQTRRFSGPTRLETAIDIARRALPAATSAILAAAFSPDPADQTRAFADSIAAGGWAADRAFPVLLTENDRLSTVTKNYLRGSVIRTVFVVGGSSAISDSTVTELQQIGMTVRRISGPTRFDTAIRIAQERGAADASKVAEVILTEGQAADAWAAGFAAGAYSASKDAPIVLSNGGTLPAPTASWLSPTAKAAATKLVCAPRVDAAACDAASTAMGHTPITGTTPRLLAVAAGTTTAGVTQIRFTFTEPVAAQVSADKFKLYSYDNLPTLASSAARDTARQDVVVASFPQGVVTQSTVAAVAFDAVRGISSTVGNAEGSVGLNSATSTSRGPNLTSVTSDSTPTNESGTANWTVLFNFDKAISSTDGCGANSKYALVGEDVSPDNSTQAHTIRGATGSAAVVGTSTCKVEFRVPEDFAFDQHVARGFVDAGTVKAANGGFPNPPSATSGGTSAGPDLESVRRTSATSSQLIFRFDKPIDSAVNVNQAAALFKAYDSRGRVFPGTSAAPNTPEGSNIREVIVTFAPGELRNVIMGGSVDAGAVKGVPTLNGTTASPGLFNGPDARAMAATSFPAGSTAAPKLVSVTRTTAGSGSTASVTIRFTYSAQVERGAGTYAVYTDTERVALPSCSVVTAAGGEEVDCTVSASSTAQYNAARAGTYAAGAFDAIRPDGQSGTDNSRWSSSPEHGGTIA